jgi:hypothetical protein
MFFVQRLQTGLVPTHLVQCVCVGGGGFFFGSKIVGAWSWNTPWSGVANKWGREFIPHRQLPLCHTLYNTCCSSSSPSEGYVAVQVSPSV